MAGVEANKVKHENFAEIQAAQDDLAEMITKNPSFRKYMKTFYGPMESIKLEGFKCPLRA